MSFRKRPTEAEVWGRVQDRVKPVNEGVQLIHVCDRGADNFDVFAHRKERGDSWVIRTAQLTRKVRYGDQVIKLSEVMDCVAALGSYQVYVAANGKQKARWAQVESVRPRLRYCAHMKDRPRLSSTTTSKKSRATSSKCAKCTLPRIANRYAGCFTPVNRHRTLHKPCA